MAKYITEYLTINEGDASVKLSFPPLFLEETKKYSLLSDTFSIYNSLHQKYITLSGEIEKRENGFFLNFSNTFPKDFFNIVVTYGVADNTNNEIEEIKSLLNIKMDKPNDFEILKKEFISNNFIEHSSKEIVYLPTIITEKTKYLASQYRKSIRLKNLLLSSLIPLQEVFLETNKIPTILNLKRAFGHNLDLIGKIVGVGRHYCGNFADINYMFYKENKIEHNLHETTLSDECMKKLIVVKIIKNAKKIVNYKELRDILAVFFEDENFSFMIDDFEIIIDTRAYNINDECLILLRAFLPTPPTHKIYYLKNFMSVDDKPKLLTSFEQRAEFVLVAPKQIFKKDIKSSRILSRFINIGKYRVDTPFDKESFKLIDKNLLIGKIESISRYNLSLAPKVENFKLLHIEYVSNSEISINKSKLKFVKLNDENIKVDNRGRVKSITQQIKLREKGNSLSHEVQVSSFFLKNIIVFRINIDEKSKIYTNCIEISKGKM